MNIAQGIFDAAEDVPRFPVGHLVGELDELAVLDAFTHAESEPTRSEDGRRENPDLAVFVAKDQPADPFALLLGTTLPVKDRHMLAPANDAEIVGIFGQVSGELAVRELVVDDD